MGEFVGINPHGAWQLIRRLEDAKGLLGATRPALETAIAEAGPDWAGHQGTTAMHRAWAFFDESQRDLKWRIDTITRLEKAQVHTDGALLTTTFAFGSEAQATEAGKSAGTAITDALTAHLADGSPDGWKKVEAAMGDARVGAHDPAYAAALLAAIGPRAFRILFGQWMDANASGPRRGLPPESVRRARNSLGPLATAFGSADRSGRLGSQWHPELLEKADPATLSALLALARQSGPFLDKTGSRLLRLPTAGHRPDAPEPDWNTHWLIKAYRSDPEAFQRLLAAEQDNARLLLRPELVKLTGTPGFEKLLADALDKALRPTTGNAGTRDHAWFNTVNGLGYEGAEKLSGNYTTLQNSPINQVLAKNLTPYLEQFARDQARVSSPDLKDAFPLTPPWNGLRPDVLPRFFGALMQDPASVKILQKSFHDYTRSLDIGKFHPFGTSEERTEYTRRTAHAGGMAALLLGGSTYVELNDDQFVDFLADTVLLPVDYAVNRVPAGPAASTALGFQTNIPKNGLKEIIKTYFDNKTPETAAVVAGNLVNTQVDWVAKSLRQEKQRPLLPHDEDRLRQEFRGRLYNSVLKALENRGG